MFEAYPKFIGRTPNGTSVFEVKCPSCQSEVIEPHGDGYSCERCGVDFETQYK